jgi:hypothetical protein
MAKIHRCVRHQTLKKIRFFSPLSVIPLLSLPVELLFSYDTIGFFYRISIVTSMRSIQPCRFRSLVTSFVLLPLPIHGGQRGHLQGRQWNGSRRTYAGWAEQDSPEMEERRRNVLLRELQRVHQASFVQFLILCLIPTTLLFIVTATVLGEDEECDSAATTCEKEARTFVNAFTTRCVCETITVAMGP